MPDEYKDAPLSREDWERQASAARMDVAGRKALASALRVKPDDDAAFDDFAEMFRRYRARKAFWADVRSKGAIAAFGSLLAAGALWVVNRYVGRL